MIILKRTLILLCLTLFTTTSLAADIKNGKQLQQKNCMSCHDDGMYTREDRRIKKLSDLHAQVLRCESTLGLKWFDEEVDDVTTYLNKTFYHVE